MNVDKALVEPMCLVDGTPMYNESVHFTSYIKEATKSMEKYFNISKEMNENITMLSRIKNVRTLEELKPLVSKDCYLFSSIFQHILLEEMPEYLKDDSTGGPCTWLYFLLSNVIHVKAGVWDIVKERLVFTSTPHGLSARYNDLNKKKRSFKTPGCPRKIFADSLETFGFTYADEEDAGVFNFEYYVY